ncbi:DUF3945 domain-containing protein, partial [Bacteroides caecimuris]|uniref:DUF3945 domain-containing protein n=1 Tax=Bacteroides caecimuris TaxID=1796613 RepID=UPI003977D395
VYIPSEVKGIRLTADEINALKEGQPVYVDGMTSKNGKPFDSDQIRRGDRKIIVEIITNMNYWNYIP